MATPKATELFGKQIQFLMSKVPPRELMGEVLSGALKSIEDVETEFGYVELDSVTESQLNAGPLGGTSAQITCIFVDTKGRRHGVIVNVYAGEPGVRIMVDDEDVEHVVGSSGTGSASRRS
jgi:hypothetical protein